MRLESLESSELVESFTVTAVESIFTADEINKFTDILYTKRFPEQK